MLSSIVERLKGGIFKGLLVDVLRLDLLHPYTGGNKYYKLKYNLEKAKELGKGTLLTFGGAYSNHLLATALAGKEAGFRTIGIVRGEEPENYSPTLLDAKSAKMQLEFWSREKYKAKDDFETLMDLETRYNDFYLIPEGGSNSLAVKGTSEILNDVDEKYTHICVAAGTGGTAAGLLSVLNDHQQLLVFPVLKGGGFLKEEILKHAHSFLSTEFDREAISKKLTLHCDFHFGGYAKYTDELINFMLEFYKQYQIPLDFVYTGKLMFGVEQLVGNREFLKNDKVLVVHTGGLQGNRSIPELAAINT